MPACSLPNKYCSNIACRLSPGAAAAKCRGHRKAGPGCDLLGVGIVVTLLGKQLKSRPEKLLFALYEGIIAGLIRMRWGLLPAELSHGGTIFLLSGGLI